MDDTEGSVMVDGVSPEVTEESQEHVNNQEESSSEKKTDSEVKPDGEVDGKTEEVAETEDKTEETAEEKAARTEKGTKLDQDPLRQAHQLRANAEAKTRQYEDFLSDPVKVKAYLADLEKDKAGKTETKTEDLIDPEKLETVGDLQKFAKQLQTKFQTETEKIRAELGGITQKEQIKEVANRVTSEVTAVQTKYPELREFNEDGTKNPDYNELVNGIEKLLVYTLDSAAKAGQSYKGLITSYKKLGFEEYVTMVGGKTNFILYGIENKDENQFVGVMKSEDAMYAFYLRGRIGWQKIPALIQSFQADDMINIFDLNKQKSGKRPQNK